MQWPYEPRHHERKPSNLPTVAALIYVVVVLAFVFATAYFYGG